MFKLTEHHHLRCGSVLFLFFFFFPTCVFFFMLLKIDRCSEGETTAPCENTFHLHFNTTGKKTIKWTLWTLRDKVQVRVVSIWSRVRSRRVLLRSRAHVLASTRNFRVFTPCSINYFWCYSIYNPYIYTYWASLELHIICDWFYF